MAEEHVETLRGIYERWAVGDFKTEDRVDPGFTMTMGPDFPDAGVHAGREGLAAYMRIFLEPWERITIEGRGGDRFRRPGPGSVRQAGTGISSGIATELRYFQLWTFEGATPVAMETIMDETQAREHLGALGAVGTRQPSRGPG